MGKNPREKLYALSVQSLEGKYSFLVKIFEFYLSGRTLVESTESEFLATGRPNRVNDHKEKLYTSLVQSSEAKYSHSLQVKIFEFYPSGRTLVESTESEFLSVRRPIRGLTQKFPDNFNKIYIYTKLCSETFVPFKVFPRSRNTTVHLPFPTLETLLILAGKN